MSPKLLIEAMFFSKLSKKFNVRTHQLAPELLKNDKNTFNKKNKVKVIIEYLVNHS